MYLREVVRVGARIDPDGEEFRAQVAGAGLVEADVADVCRIGAADIEVSVEKALRRVGMGIDDDGRIVNLLGFGGDGGAGSGGLSKNVGRPRGEGQ